MASDNSSHMRNPSWYLFGPKTAKIQDAPIPVLKDDHDVIVRIRYIGVCGSDVHFWRHGGIGLKVSPENPLIVGHEAAGTIASVGPAVTSVKVGDRVAIEPGFPCRRCRPCRSGSYHFCPDMRFAAAPPDTHGLLTKLFRAPEDFVYRVPDGVSLQEAVVMEPTAVAVHANRLAKIRHGQDVVIMGSGAVGLLCGAVAKAFGARRLILVDILEQKLEFARGFLPCETFVPDLKASGEENAAQLKDSLNLAGGVDAVIEASGAELSAQTGIHVLKMGGSYVQTGIGKPDMQIPMLALSEKELRVRGCFRYGPGDYESALQLVAQGHVNARALISSVTLFDNAIDAWDRTGSGQGIKNLIQGVVD